jgi:hypothetical protein
VAATKQLVNRNDRRQRCGWWSVPMRAADALFVTLPRRTPATLTRDP